MLGTPYPGIPSESKFLNNAETSVSKTYRDLYEARLTNLYLTHVKTSKNKWFPDMTKKVNNISAHIRANTMPTPLPKNPNQSRI